MNRIKWAAMSITYIGIRYHPVLYIQYKGKMAIIRIIVSPAFALSLKNFGSN